MEISGEGDMSQEQLVEQTTSILETVRKINEVLKDTKVSELCEKLKAYARALDAITNKKHYMFNVHFSKLANQEYKVQLYVDGEHIYIVYIPHDASVDTMFERIFALQEIRDHVVSKIHDTLVDIAHEIADKANIVQQIKEIEERLREEDPDPAF